VVKLAVAICFRSIRLAPGSIPGRCKSFFKLICVDGAVVVELWFGDWNLAATRSHCFYNRQKRCETEALDINIALNQSLLFLILLHPTNSDAGSISICVVTDFQGYCII
jgi:hypothetical protein